MFIRLIRMYIVNNKVKNIIIIKARYKIIILKIISVLKIDL
jgi:hypothetical protein